MSELLLPAGSIEKMTYALNFGADAVYLGLADFSLRTLRKGEIITSENLKTAVDIAHSLGKKIYVTFNIFAYDSDIDLMYQNVEVLKNAAPDAVIVSDFGILNIIKRELPNMELHISTQTNTLNSEAVKFWQDLGATRVILARELSFEQIKKIRKNVPDIELEMFIHGAQCMSYSGRCLLSDYMTGYERKANKGACAQPCRWSYKLLEETRPNEYFEIVQDDKGSHILSTKDLCLVDYIKNLKEIGIDSFKIEGRTKSLYYVSACAKAYRMLLDEKISPKEARCELLKIGNRGYTTGFFTGHNDSTTYSYDISKGLAGADFLAIVKEKTDTGYKILAKNKIHLNDEVEIISPNCATKACVTEIINPKREDDTLVNTNDEAIIKFECENSNWENEWNYALLRTKGIKNTTEIQGTKICE